MINLTASETDTAGATWSLEIVIIVTKELLLVVTQSHGSRRYNKYIIKYKCQLKNCLHMHDLNYNAFLKLGVLSPTK